MRVRHTLFIKILLWFFLNLLVVGGLLFFSFDLDFRVGPDSALFGRNQNRMPILAFNLSRDLATTEKSEWDRILKGYSDVYKVDFGLFMPGGGYVAGTKFKLPEQVMAEISLRQGHGVAEASGTGDGPGRPPEVPGIHAKPDAPPECIHQGAGSDECPVCKSGACGRGGMFKPPHFKIKTSDPSMYWSGVRLPVHGRSGNGPDFYFLVGRSTSITGNGLFMDPRPWVMMAILLVVLSTILWIPMIRSITRPLRIMTEATERIANGRFETRVDDRRNDEIGRLGTAINDMSDRLSRMIFGQKRFLGDAAHELASPLARMQLGAAILEENVRDDANRDRVLALKDEIQQMSDLVNGLLSFSRSDPSSGRVRLEPVNVFQVAARVIDREVPDETMEVSVSVPEDIEVMADAELLNRTVGNLVRNAVRYAGNAGPIEVSARIQGSDVIIEVADRGPGVPDAMLQQIFEPFYRVEPSRDRDSGGVGLGLAIVKTAVSACHGSVRATNRDGGGLLVSVRIPVAAR